MGEGRGERGRWQREGGNGMGVHDGHRKRVKEEFLKSGLDHLPPHRVLELLLFYSIPQGDTNELAHALIRRFGSLSAVLDAPYEELVKQPGVGLHTASHIRLISSVARPATRTRGGVIQMPQSAPVWSQMQGLFRTRSRYRSRVSWVRMFTDSR